MRIYLDSFDLTILSRMGIYLGSLYLTILSRIRTDLEQSWHNRTSQHGKGTNKLGPLAKYGPLEIGTKLSYCFMTVTRP